MCITMKKFYLFIASLILCSAVVSAQTVIKVQSSEDFSNAIATAATKTGEDVSIIITNNFSTAATIPNGAWKSLSIYSETNNTITASNTTDPIITIDGASNVTIQGLSFTGQTSAVIKGTGNTMNITIDSNNFYDHFPTAGTAYGIYTEGGASNWTIEGNSFYRIPTTGLNATNAQLTCISLTAESGSYNINNNYIGGKAPLATAGDFILMGGLTCINCSGDCTFDINNNTIGSLKFLMTTEIYTIKNNSISTGVKNIKNNTIKDISVAARLNASFYGIYSNSRNEVIEGNTIIIPIIANATAKSHGIYTVNDIDVTKINSNYILDKSSGIGEYYGIYTEKANIITNNVIVLKNDNAASSQQGIYSIGSINTTTIQHNTVSVASSSTNSAAFNLQNKVDQTVFDIRNNIFSNKSGGVININFGDDYLLLGDGSILNYNYYYGNKYYNPSGSASDDLETWKDDVVGWGDAFGYDYTIDPNSTDLKAEGLETIFENAGGTTPEDYQPIIPMPGTNVGVTTDFGGAERADVPTAGAWEYIAPEPTIEIYGSDGADGLYYSDLYDAFDALTEVYDKQEGRNIEIRIYADTEAPTRNKPTLVNGNWESVVIYPTKPGLSIKMGDKLSYIFLDGATNVTFDGRVGREGTTADLSIKGTADQYILNLNSARNTTIQYCNITGKSPNSNERPSYAIYNSGSNNVTVSNNNFFDCLSTSRAEDAIIYSVGLSTGWKITGNSFYELEEAAIGANIVYETCYCISATNFQDFEISGNYFGGSAPQCEGMWTMSAQNGFKKFNPIHITGSGAGTISNNTIRNFDWDISNANTVAELLDVAAIDATASTLTIQNNTIDHFKITATGKRFDVSGIVASGNINCNNNTIDAQLDGYSGASTFVRLIEIDGTTGTEIYGNKLSIAPTTVTGSNSEEIFGLNLIALSGTGTVYNNLLNAIRGTTIGNKSGNVNFFELNGTGTITLYNNQVNAANFTTSTGLNAVAPSHNATSIGNVNLYYNTFKLQSPSAFTVLNLKMSGNMVDIRNNLIVADGAGKVFGLTGGTMNYNNYYTIGDAVFADGYSTLDDWKNAEEQTQDANSLANDPLFVLSAGILIPQADLPGDATLLSSYGTDLRGTSRSNTPSMGAVESTFTANRWVGGTSSAWNVGENWSSGTALAPDAQTDVIFASDAANPLQMNANYVVRDIINPSDANLDVNGQKLTINGDIQQTGGGKIDASAENSTISFAGSEALEVSGDNFVDNKVNTLELNKNVTLSGVLDVNTVAATAGKLNVVANEASITLSGDQTLGDIVDAAGFYNLTINADVDVNSDLLIANNLTINEDKKLTIPAGKAVRVEGTVDNQAGTNGLLIKSDGTNPNGAFVFKNKENAVLATVELFTKSTTNNADKSSEYTRQHIAIPVQSLSKNLLKGTSVQYWNESGYKWSNASTLSKFDGYRITQQNSTDGYLYTIAGELVNEDINKSLGYTSTTTDPGMQLIGNSYTAAIRIKDIKLTNAKQSVSIFNTGSATQWSDGSGDNAGQYVTVPIAQAGEGGLPSEISSLQAFSVQATGTNASISVSYNDAVGKNTGKMRSAAQSKVYTIVDLKNGENTIDRLWIFTEENCTKAYNDGWDGVKILSAGVPALFAMEEDGNYQVNSLDNIDNTYLGFIAGSGVDTYTLEFSHYNTGEKYPELYLVDEFEDKEMNIAQSAATYTFSATNAGETVKRFKISTRAAGGDGGGETTGLINVTYDNDVLQLQNLSNRSGEYIIYDMFGRIVTQQLLGATTTQNVELNVTSGVYVLKATIGKDTLIQKITF